MNNTAKRMRLEELRGFHVRLRVVQGKSIATLDGICQGVEGSCAVLAPSSQGERVEVPLEQIGAVTLLPGIFGGGTIEEDG